IKKTSENQVICCKNMCVTLAHISVDHTRRIYYHRFLVYDVVEYPSESTYISGNALDKGNKNTSEISAKEYILNEYKGGINEIEENQNEAGNENQVGELNKNENKERGEIKQNENKERGEIKQNENKEEGKKTTENVEKTTKGG